MTAHSLAVGVLFFRPVIGVGPGPRRPGRLTRMPELFAGTPFHAFFAIALMRASTPMVGTFANPPASLGIDSLSGQNAAGGIARAFSEIPSVPVLIALLLQWCGSESGRPDAKGRAADRDGDREFRAYHACLASLNIRGSR